MITGGDDILDWIYEIGFERKGGKKRGKNKAIIFFLLTRLKLELVVDESC